MPREKRNQAARTGLCGCCGGAIGDGRLAGRCPQCLLVLALPEGAGAETLDVRGASAFLQPGRIGHYEILGELGRGGMGVVYRARDANLNRFVAVKRILSQQLASPDVFTRFRIEAEAIARLDHPNIVPLYEIGDWQGIAFFSMKLVEGDNLAEQLAPKKSGTAGAEADASGLESGWKCGAPTDFQARTGRWLPVLAKVSRAVHHAHLRGILHRDLKPANILLNQEDEPFVSDFGLAKCLENDGGLTRTASLLGSPAYMAPEQASGGGAQITTAADVYSLGVILYEILTGKPPFQAASPMETVRQAAQEEPRPPRSINRRVSRDLETVCLRCLEKDPANRYGSARELAEDLERWLSGKPVLARRASRVEQFMRWSRRNPGLFLACLASVALFLCIGLVSFLAAVRIDSANQRAEALLKRMQLEKAESYLAQDQPNHGLALLAHVLRNDPGDLATLRRLESALSRRYFAWANADPVHTRSRLVYRKIMGDSKQAVTVDDQGRIRRWNLEDGREPEEIVDFQTMTLTAHADAGGTWIALGFNNGQAKLVHLETRRVIPLPAHPDSVRQVCLSRAGDRVITVFGSAGYRLWDSQTGAPLSDELEFPAHIRVVRFSPDGRRFLVTGENGEIHLSDAQTGRLERTLTHDGSPNLTVAFSPDSRSIGAGTLTGAVWIWRLDQGNGLEAEHRHRGAVRVVAFDPAGSILLSAGADGEARFHDAGNGAAIGRPMKHLDLIQHAAFNREGTRALTASHDNTVRVWRVPEGLPLFEPMPHLSGVEVAGFTRDGRRVISAGYDGTLWVWDLLSPINSPLVHTHRAPVTGARLNSAGDRILSAARDGTVRLWDAASGDVLFELSHDEPVTAACFSQNDAWILTGEDSGRVTLWDARSGARLHQWPSTGSPVRSLEAGPRHRRVLAVQGNSLVRILPSRDFEADPIRVSFGGTLVDAKFNDDGSAFLTAETEGRVTLFNSETGKQLWQSPFLGGAVTTAGLLPNTSELLYAGGYSGRVCNLENPSLSREFPHEMNVSWISASPDGEWIATASNDGTAGLWKRGAADPFQARLAHPAPVSYVEFSRDSLRLLTIAEDDRVRVWDVRTGQLTDEPFRHHDRISAAHFSPDGLRVLTASFDGTAKLWSLSQAGLADADWLVELAECLARRTVLPDGREKALEPGEYRRKLQQLKERHGRVEFISRLPR